MKQFVWNQKVRYLVFGGLTTGVNILTYVVLTRIFHLPDTTANVVAIMTAILFAYVVNERYVFENTAITPQAKWRTFLMFVVSRMASLIVEVCGFYLLSEIFKLNDIVAKVAITIIVVLLNYIVSKWIFEK